MFEYVETSARYCAGFDGVGEVVYFAHFAAADVDEVRRGFHEGESSRVEHAFGFGCVRDGGDDKVRERQECVEFVRGVEFDIGQFVFGSRFDADDGHPQFIAQARCLVSDTANAVDEDCCAGEVYVRGFACVLVPYSAPLCVHVPR